MMTTDTLVPWHADIVASLLQQLCTRTCSQFALEAREDGESLQDAVQRYELDYAWQVLGSDRLLDESLAILAGRLRGGVMTPAQRGRAVAVLQAAAAGVQSELLMSYDNDAAEVCAQLLEAWFVNEAALLAGGKQMTGASTD